MSQHVSVVDVLAQLLGEHDLGRATLQLDLRGAKRSTRRRQARMRNQCKVTGLGNRLQPHPGLSPWRA